MCPHCRKAIVVGMAVCLCLGRSRLRATCIRKGPIRRRPGPIAIAIGHRTHRPDRPSLTVLAAF